MPMVKQLVSLPKELGAKLRGMKKKGYTASGFIRALLEREFRQKKTKKGA